jgi:hypothetical protein
VRQAAHCDPAINKQTRVFFTPTKQTTGSYILPPLFQKELYVAIEFAFWLAVHRERMKAGEECIIPILGGTLPN